jgi:DNA polymerase-1
LEVDFRWSSEENHHKYYKTLQDTEHSYQIIQGDLGWSYYKTYQNKALFVLILKLWTRCLACRVSRDFFLLWKGKGFYVPFRESGWSKALAEKFTFSKTKKSRKLDRIWNMI